MAKRTARAATTTPAITNGAHLIPWSVAGFKLKDTPKAYPQDDGSTTTTVAVAVCMINGSHFGFPMNITRVVPKDGNPGFRISMPSTPRGNIRAGVIFSDHAESKLALEMFKTDVLQQFKTWATAQGGIRQSVTRTAPALIDLGF